MPSVREVLERWGFQLVEDMKAAIDTAIAADGGGQSSKLSGSVKYEVKRSIEGYTFSLSMNDYWKFVEDGRKPGKAPPPKAMLEFVKRRHIKVDISTRKKKVLKSIRTKGIRQREKAISIEKKQKQVAFLIGRKIAKDGVEAHPFFDKVFNQARLDRLTEQLKPVIKEEIVFNIKEVLKDIK